jgi:hypothetical protein
MANHYRLARRTVFRFLQQRFQFSNRAVEKQRLDAPRH